MTAFASIIRPVAAAVRQAISLRGYQSAAAAEIYGYWAQGFDNVLAVLPTGAGKTVLFSSILADHRGAAIAIAHRQELVGQISLALNSFGVRHRIIAPQKTVQLITARHLREHKVSYYDPGAMIGVAGVASLASVEKKPQHAAFIKAVTLWVQDEAHHVLKENGWGRATMLFGRPLMVDGKPHITRREGVKGLGVTASPKRADGQGLSRETDGLFDAMVLGPSMRDLINSGFLTPYQIRSVPCVVDYSSVKVTASGEYSQAKLVAAEGDAVDLVGDIVGQYLKYAAGKRGVTFVSGVKRTVEVAAAFNAAGVPAMALDGTTDDNVRDEAIQKLERGELLQLVNCDLFGEGFDLPAIEVISMGTKTASLARYIQWFGRVLRLMLNDDEKRGFNQLTDDQRRAVIAGSVKPYGLVIDHGANLIEHDGPPDIPRVWALGRYGKKGSGAAENVGYRVCTNKGLELVGSFSWEEFRLQGWSDTQLLEQGHAIDRGLPCVTPYPATERVCPACGYMPKPISRSDPQHVDGDLVLLDEATLAELFRAKAEALQTDQQYWDYLSVKKVPHVQAYSLAKHHSARVAQLGQLGEAMGLWGGLWKGRGDTDSQLQRRFYSLFGIDVITAQALKRDDAEKLTAQLWAKLAFDNVVKPD
jgi:DNA repair protein RadD